MKKVSVVIIARNEEENIGRCIKSVLKQNYKDLEIIVVNDASTDKTAEIAKKLNVKVINNKKNLGIAKSFNRGIKISKGKIIVTLHADAELIGTSWINDMVNILLEKKDLGAVTSYREPYIKEKLSPIEKVNLYFGGAYITSKPKKISEIDWLPTRCDVFKKVALKKVNYFNNRLRVSGDCIDISTKLKNVGYKLMINPKVKTKVYLSTQQNNFRKILNKRINFGKVIPYLLIRHSFSLINNKTWVVTTFPYIAYFLFFILSLFNPIFLIFLFLENLFLSMRIAKITGISSFPAAFVLLPIYTILWNLSIIYGVFLIHRKII